MTLFRAILSELLIPDAYPGDWYRWTGGQAGHAVLIGAPLALVAMTLGCPPTAAPIVVAAVYFFVWEMLIQRSPDWADSAADTWHVGCGAGLIALPMVAAAPATLGQMLLATGALWLIWSVTILCGIHRRIHKKDR